MDTSTSQLTSTDSSSSSLSPSWDVFLSFYGKDSRNNFTAHLYSALHQSAIRTYRDDPELEKGQEISSGLLKAIHDSKASIVVLSNNYARSAWCLDELVEILACRKSNFLMVFPVFYHVEPSDIRRQKGSFGEALEIHKTCHSADKIGKWSAALTEIADRSGYHIKRDSDVNESDTIQQIVKDVALQVCTKALQLEENLVGIDSAVEEVYEKLSMQSNDVRAIGICGMGGIGKTTIAKAFYNKYLHKFHSGCFAEYVKETLQGPHRLLSLLKQLLVQLLRINDFNVLDVESGIRKLNEIFSSRIVLIVLDDFDESSDLELLLRRCNLFSPKSRIIITTRDANLLHRLEVETYAVKELGEIESLELFSYHAFKTTIPSKDFKDLSKRFVKYAGGLPLALKVLGSSLRCRTVSFWNGKLEKVKEIPENRIHKILKLSYDELSDTTVKSIFLDIVFFFLGHDIEEAVLIFKSCGFYPDNGIPILVDNCLLTIENNKFKMHNLIRDMGREIIRQESKDLGKSKRLSCEGNEVELLKDQEGTDKIEGLIINLATWTKKRFSSKIFEKMPNLRLLEITNGTQDFKGSFRNSFQELRCIRWHYCPWTHLPSSFRSQKLIFLDMQFSNFKALWKGRLPLVNLKSINVGWSKCLTTTPNFSKVKMLDKLSFTSCGNLLKVHRSIVQLTNLGHLDLHECDKLKRLPEQLGDMKSLKILDASNTSIKQLPTTIGQLKKLYALKLVGCKKLIELPEQIGSMEGLRIFDASFSAIRKLPDSFVGLINLVDLILYHCENLICLPHNIWKPNLPKVSNISHCSNLDQLPCLSKLDASYTAIEQLTDSVGQLSRLQRMDLRGCKKLWNKRGGIWNLTSLESLELWQSDNLKDLPDSVKNMKRLECLSTRCRIRLCMPMILGLSSLKDVGQNCTSLGSTFPRLPLNLENLFIYSYVLLEQLPDLSSFTRLKILWISKCNSLQSLPLLPPHLTQLDINDCTSLRDPPILTSLKDLEHLTITNCSNLKFIMDESFFQVRTSSVFQAHVVPITEIPNWFRNKRNGCKVYCDFPPLSGKKFLGMVLWVVYRCQSYESFDIRALISNKTDGTKHSYIVCQYKMGEVGSVIYCIYGVHNLPNFSSEDRIKVLFEPVRFSSSAGYLKVSERDTKVEKCGIHFLYKPLHLLKS